jgi:hypothetical protein
MNILRWNTSNGDARFNAVSWKGEDFWWHELQWRKMSQRTWTSRTPTLKEKDPWNAGICEVFRTQHCWWSSLDSLVLVSEIWIYGMLCALALTWFSKLESKAGITRISE